MSILNDAKVSLLTTKNLNFNGRQIKNAGDATDKQDYVTLNDLNTNLAPSAYTDTTNAANITSGILAPQRLPNPTLGSIGGVKAIALVAHKFVQWLDSMGNLQLAQPAFTDISGVATTAQIPTAALPPSTQTILSPSFSTVYQNTNSTPLYIVITLDLTSTTTIPATVFAQTDASNPPTTVVAKASNAVEPHALIFTSTITVPISFIVLPNYYYEFVVSIGTCAIDSCIGWF